MKPQMSASGKIVVIMPTRTIVYVTIQLLIYSKEPTLGPTLAIRVIFPARISSLRSGISLMIIIENNITPHGSVAKNASRVIICDWTKNEPRPMIGPKFINSPISPNP